MRETRNKPARKIFAVAAAALSLSVAAPAAAAVTFNTDASSTLLGVSNVDVGGVLYNVTFVSGTCANAFTGCDANSDFNFTTLAQANLAAQALLSQVFGTNNFWDQNAPYTNGCSADPYNCYVLIPYAVSGSTVSAAFTFNWSESLGAGDTDHTGTVTLSPSATYSNGTYARFSLVNAAVPEPATWAMMLVGFGGIGFAMRRRRQPLLQIA